MTFFAFSFQEKENQAAEAEGKKAGVRILSVDDFYVNEEGAFEYEKEMEAVYQKQLVKLISRQMDDGFFNFLIVDAINQTATELMSLPLRHALGNFR